MRTPVIAAVAALSLSAPAALEAKVLSAPGFRLPAGQPLKIFVFEPDVRVGSFSLGGRSHNAGWTATAQRQMAETLRASAASTRGMQLIVSDAQRADPVVVSEYQALFRNVAAAAALNSSGGKLPTKKGRFDWTLGPGTARLAETTGADYGLFVSTNDAYGTTERKVAQFLLATVIGIPMKAGIHSGYAALVDLRTGALVWLNYQKEVGGDPRTGPGATKRITRLLAPLGKAMRPARAAATGRQRAPAARVSR